MKKTYRTGEKNINYQGLKMWICDYRKCTDIDVEFEDGYISKNRAYQEFKNGKIKNLYFPEVFGVGYVGEGKYKPRVNGKISKEYRQWISMLNRCYSKKYHEKHPTYEDCKVCNEWLNFQSFAKWFNENYYRVNNERMDLDKDILIKGNKVYSPETCIFVPQLINLLLIKSNKTRGKFPIGVSFHKRDKKFIAQCHVKKSLKHLGNFDTEIEAFNAYKQFKESYIKQVADEYKDKIPKKLYDIMYCYKVDISD